MSDLIRKSFLMEIIQNLKRRDCIVFMTNGVLREGIVIKDYTGVGSDSINVKMVSGCKYSLHDDNDKIYNYLKNEFSLIEQISNRKTIHQTNLLDKWRDSLTNEKQFIDKDDFINKAQKSFNVLPSFLKMSNNSFYGSIDPLYPNSDKNFHIYSTSPFFHTEKKVYKNTIRLNDSDEPFLLKGIETHLCPMEVMINF